MDLVDNLHLLFFNVINGIILKNASSKDCYLNDYNYSNIKSLLVIAQEELNRCSKCNYDGSVLFSYISTVTAVIITLIFLTVLGFYVLLTKQDIFNKEFSCLTNGFAIATVFAPFPFAIYLEDGDKTWDKALGYFIAYFAQYPLWKFLKKNECISMAHYLGKRYNFHLAKIWTFVDILLVVLRLRQLSVVILNFFEAGHSDIKIYVEYIMYIVGMVAGIQFPLIFDTVIFICMTMYYIGLSSVSSDLTHFYDEDKTEYYSKSHSSAVNYTVNFNVLIKSFSEHFVYQAGYFWYYQNKSKINCKTSYLIGLLFITFQMGYALDINSIFNFLKQEVKDYIKIDSYLTVVLLRYTRCTSKKIKFKNLLNDVIFKKDSYSYFDSIRILQMSFMNTFSLGLYSIFLAYSLSGSLWQICESLQVRNLININRLDKWALTWVSNIMMFQLIYNLSLLHTGIESNDTIENGNDYFSLICCWKVPLMIAILFIKEINLIQIIATSAVMLLISVLLISIGVQKPQHQFMFITCLIVIRIISWLQNKMLQRMNYVPEEMVMNNENEGNSINSSRNNTQSSNNESTDLSDSN